MEDEFLISVTNSAKTLQFPARLHKYGYSYKIAVEVNGVTLMFEPDEERNWRAQLLPEQFELRDKIDVRLLESIASEIEKIVN
jgi:hypothetical protein